MTVNYILQRGKNVDKTPGGMKLFFGEGLTPASISLDGDFAGQEKGDWILLSNLEASARGMSTEATLLEIKALINQVSGEKALTSNTTAALLLANGEFIGSYESVAGYEGVRINIRASHNSAANGILIEWSDSNTIGTAILELRSQFTFDQAAGFAAVIPVRAPYFRIRYTNTNSNQTVFALTSTAVAKYAFVDSRFPIPITGVFADNEIVIDQTTPGTTNGVVVNNTVAITGTAIAIGSHADGVAVSTAPVRIAGKFSGNVKDVAATAEGALLVETSKPIVTVDITTGTAAVQGLAANAGQKFFGYFIEETASSPAAAKVVIRQGTSGAGIPLVIITLSGDGFEFKMLSDFRGIDASAGIYVDRISGETRLTLLYQDW